MKTLLFGAFGCAAVFGCQAGALGPEAANGIIAVSSRVSKDYVRARLADGSFVPETYAFGEGGNWGTEVKDATFEKLKFIDVARVIAGPLASRKYTATRNAGTTRLLIMVYWGTTRVPPPYGNDPMYQNYRHAIDEYNILMADGAVDAAVSVYNAGLLQLNIENGIRDRMDYRNAKLLGYDGEDYGNVATDYGRMISHSALGEDQRDETGEIEDNRYFVVLLAYDFQAVWKQKRHTLLWETRFSINERHNAFDQALPVMAKMASRFFGQPTNGLVRDRVGDGRVEVGTPTVIEFLSGKK
ncbi:MAG TPA: hypothetical protein VGG34_05195 [Opitutaceae bacterium]|jgi:hypothetical protein